jgi:hypothetical protein
MEEKQRKLCLTAALSCMLFFSLGYASQVLAMGVVAGRYLERSGTAIALEITIGSPAPASLIVIQHLPPGTKIAKADPAYKKYNAGTGEVRWLLRKPPAGTITIRLIPAAPAVSGKVHAELRCMDPATGELITSRVE